MSTAHTFVVTSLNQNGRKSLEEAPETNTLEASSTAFVAGFTALLVLIAIIYAIQAIKGHINAASTVEALFSGMDKATIKKFTIHRPKLEHIENKRQSKRTVKQVEQLQKQFDNIETEVIKLISTVNPALMPQKEEALPFGPKDNGEQASKPNKQGLTGFCEILGQKFQKQDPLVAKIIVFLWESLKSLIRFLFCMKKPENGSVKILQATQSSSALMLKLSVHLNQLITWITSVFSVALAFTYLGANFTDSNLYSLILWVSIINALISCCSGFFISKYIIKNLERSLSQQILTVFFQSTDERHSTMEFSNENKQHQPRALIKEKKGATTKVVIFIIVISLALAICISTLLKLIYKERLTALITFLLASIADVIILRPTIVLADVLLEFTGIRITGYGRKKKSKQGTLLKSSAVAALDQSSLQGINVTGFYLLGEKCSHQQDLTDKNQFESVQVDKQSPNGYFGQISQPQNIIVNQVFRAMIEQDEKPISHKYQELYFPTRAKILVAELAMLSFAEQTYGPKATFKIFKEIDSGKVQTFDLIERLKEKIFLPKFTSHYNLSTSNGINQDKLFITGDIENDRISLLQNDVSKNLDLELSKDSQKTPLKTISEVSGQKERSSEFTSGRRSMLERSIQQKIDERQSILDYNMENNVMQVNETDEDIDEREMSSRSPLRGLSMIQSTPQRHTITMQSGIKQGETPPQALQHSEPEIASDVYNSPHEQKKSLASSFKNGFLGFNIIQDALRKSSPSKLLHFKGSRDHQLLPEEDDPSFEKGTGMRNLESQERLDSEAPLNERTQSQLLNPVEDNHQGIAEEPLQEASQHINFHLITIQGDEEEPTTNEQLITLHGIPSGNYTATTMSTQGPTHLNNAQLVQLISQEQPDDHEVILIQDGRRKVNIKEKFQRKRSALGGNQSSHDTLTSALTRGDDQQEEEKDTVPQDNQSISGYSQVHSYLFQDQASLNNQVTTERAASTTSIFNIKVGEQKRYQNGRAPTIIEIDDNPDQTDNDYLMQRPDTGVQTKTSRAPSNKRKNFSKRMKTGSQTRPMERDQIIVPHLQHDFSMYEPKATRKSINNISSHERKPPLPQTAQVKPTSTHQYSNSLATGQRKLDGNNSAFLNTTQNSTVLSLMNQRQNLLSGGEQGAQLSLEDMTEGNHFEQTMRVMSAITSERPKNDESQAMSINDPRIHKYFGEEEDKTEFKEDNKGEVLRRPSHQSKQVKTPGTHQNAAPIDFYVMADGAYSNLNDQREELFSAQSAQRCRSLNPSQPQGKSERGLRNYESQKPVQQPFTNAVYFGQIEQDVIISDTSSNNANLIKGQKRAISHENPKQGYGMKGHLSNNDLIHRSDSKQNILLVNQHLLKQVRQPIVEKHLKKQSYLKYSAFSQLSNNKDGALAARSDEDSRSLENQSQLRSSLVRHPAFMNEELQQTPNFIDF